MNGEAWLVGWVLEVCTQDFMLDHIQPFLTTLLGPTVITGLLVLRASAMHVDLGGGMVSYWDKPFTPPGGTKARRNSVFLVVTCKFPAPLTPLACVSRRHFAKGLMTKMKRGS